MTSRTTEDDGTSGAPIESGLPFAWIERLLILGLRLTAIMLVARILLALPMPVIDTWLPLRDVVVVVGAVIFSGKALVDTFFYDRYVP